MKNKILFILKRKEGGDITSKLGLSTGLYNSAMLICDMLSKNNILSALEVVVDNNCIDRVVNIHKPTHVIIEALWVVPSKFTILCKLYPDVKWIIRLHSEVPFLSSEGVAMDWIGDYVKYDNLFVALNSNRSFGDIGGYLNLISCNKIIFLPNFYEQTYSTKEYVLDEYVNIGCFGAVRPMKNHLSQALAAIKFANIINKKLKFHINSGRIEMKGDPVIHNLQGLFLQLQETSHQLIHHDWVEREDFLQLCAKMDIGMQVSFSETFNIVGADFTSQGVPLVASKEIPWLDATFAADPTDINDMCNKLLCTHENSRLNVDNNQKLLTDYTDNTREIWIKYFL